MPTEIDDVPVYCPSCENPCSRQAESCPRCGHPMGAARTARPVKPIEALARASQQQFGPPVIVRPIPTVQTIEKTGKVWKFFQLVGAVALLFGITSCIVTVMEPVESAGTVYQGDLATALALVVAVLGFIVYLFGRIGAWWYHG